MLLGESHDDLSIGEHFVIPSTYAVEYLRRGARDERVIDWFRGSPARMKYEEADHSVEGYALRSLVLEEEDGLSNGALPILVGAATVSVAVNPAVTLKGREVYLKWGRSMPESEV